MLIRWSILLPRLTVLVLLFGVVWMTQGTLVRHLVQFYIANQTGLSAQIGLAQLEPLEGKVVLTNLQLADRNGPSHDLCTIKTITAQAQLPDLFYRYLHLSEVRIEGIQTPVEVREEGQFMPAPLWEKMKKHGPKELKMIGELDWTTLFSESSDKIVLQLLEQFETSPIAKDIRLRWPEEMKKIEGVSETIRQRFQNIKTQLDQAGTQADKIALLNMLLSEIQGAETDIRKLFSDMELMKNRAQSDYQSLLKATQQDQAALRTLRPPQLDTQRFSETLIGPMVKEEWDKMQMWGEWVRSLLDPAETDTGTTLYERIGLKPPKKFRGETIPLANREMRPELFVEKAHLNGQILLGQTPVFFNGTVCNFVHPIEKGMEPIFVEFCFSGSGVPVSPFYVENEHIAAAQLPAVVDWSLLPNTYVSLYVDRKEESQQDTLVVTCPRYQLPQHTLGNPKKFAIAVSPGLSSLGGVLRVRGESISGQIQITQKKVRLAVCLPEKLRNSPLQQILQQELDTFDSVTAEIFVEGTCAEPIYTFKTNIADAIRPKIEKLFADEWKSILEKAGMVLTADANQTVALLDETIRNKMDPLLAELTNQRTQLEQQMRQQGVEKIQDTIPGLLKMLQGKY